MKITANTRTSVQHNHALITPDSYVSSSIPGWGHCDIRVIINPAMGAEFSQHLIKMNPQSHVSSATKDSEIFLYVVEGGCSVKVNTEDHALSKGGFIYIPPACTYSISSSGAEILTFQKTYEILKGYSIPSILSGNSKDFPKNLYLDDPQLHMQYLLPTDDLSFDMGINIFTYNPGGNLPFVEVHIMEHGLLYLGGQGIYRLDEKWYPVQKGDCIWMAPYCPQWFTAMGKEDAVYIYYKNVNRHSMGQ